MLTKEEYLYCYGNIRDAMKKICLSCQEDERCKGCDIFNDLHNFRKIIHEHFELVEKIKTGELSDGYHTFNELYYHRAILFSVILNVYQSKGWKSKKHHDGTMFDGVFIVGIDTPKGQYSYHYDLNLWSLFNVKELEYAPEWDGHKSSDIDRLLLLNYGQTIKPYKFEDLKPNLWVWDEKYEMMILITFIDKQFKKFHFCLTEYDGFNDEYVNVEYTEYFEENRFYPVIKSLEYKK